MIFDVFIFPFFEYIQTHLIIFIDKYNYLIFLLFIYYILHLLMSQAFFVYSTHSTTYGAQLAHDWISVLLWYELFFSILLKWTCNFWRMQALILKGEPLFTRSLRTFLSFRFSLFTLWIHLVMLYGTFDPFSCKEIAIKIINVQSIK